MNRLSTVKRVAVVAALCEANSIRATVRMTGVAKNTIAKLLVELGAACSKYQDEKIRGLRSKRIQADEIWSFVYSKQKNVPTDKQGEFGYGNVWTWTALDADSKLVVSWRLGSRDASTAYDFMNDVAGRVATRVHLSTDGNRLYLEAVENAFEMEIDCAMLRKVYGADLEGDTRYSPAKCIGCEVKHLSGQPDPKPITTSYVERQNLTMRMSMRRFTRLTHAFSKKLENHAAMVALYFMYYNFGRVHQTIRVTPAMEAGISDHVWSISEILSLLEG